MIGRSLLHALESLFYLPANNAENARQLFSTPPPKAVV
jgi:hypothetical protein